MTEEQHRCETDVDGKACWWRRWWRPTQVHPWEGWIASHDVPEELRGPVYWDEARDALIRRMA